MPNSGNIATISGNQITDSSIDLSTKADLVGGKVPSSQLPSYVDDVQEYANLAAFPATGETGIIYVAIDTNKIYRWSGTVYIEISPDTGTAWGGITGTLSNQTDLQNALNAKEPTITAGTSAQYYRGDKTFQTLNTAAVPESGNLYYTDARARAAISSTATGITYTSGTGVLSVTAGYVIPTTTEQTNWGSAYTHSTTTTGSVHGSTTVGGNLLRLTNPSAITFIRINADNTVSTLDAATFRSAIGAGTSSTTGTVTSVSGTGTVSGLSLSGTVTTSGSITLSGTLAVTASNFSSQTANTFLAAPNGTAGVPTFRTIAAADIPTLNQNTTGSAGSVTNSFIVRADSGTTEGTDLYTFNGSAAKNINFIAGSNITITKAAGSWTFAATQPTVGNGTLTLAVSGTGLSGSASFTANQSGNTTFTVTSNATSANTASTIVARDASGNFSAGTITAALSGNATTATRLAAVNVTSSTTSTWNPQSLTYQAFGQAWVQSAISADSGDLVLWLRPSQYSAGATEVCMMIDGDYYAGTGVHKVWHAGNLTNLNQLTNGPGYITSSSLSSYLPLAGGIMTGKITTPSSGADTYGGAIEIRERGYVLATENAWSFSPAITFHWGNRWAKRFGGRADGLFAIDDEPIALRSWVTSQGYITGYTEIDTLASVTGRGNTTSTTISAANFQNGYQALNLDTIKVPGLYNYDGGISGAQPLGIDWFNVRTIEAGSTSRYSQFVMPYSADRIFYRRQADAGWQSYVELWHTGNDGSGSGLDADLLDGYHESSFLRYYGYSTSGDFQTFQSTAGRIRFDQVGAIDDPAWTNEPTGVYTYGGVVSFRGANFGLQIYGSHTGNLTFKTQWDNDQYSGWREILHSVNYNSYAPTLTGGGASGNWGINITGSAATLTTSRTIWGQSFNGSANVTGALSGATTIAMSGQLTNTVAVGTAPFVITSTTRVANLNVATAGTADTLTTARTINGTSFNGSANITTANWGTAQTITIGNTGKSVNGSANVSWTLAEIGALPLIGGTLTGDLIITAANDVTTGGGQIYLNGATGNRIDFNQNGVAAPTVSTRSVGTKILLYPDLSATQVDYALGIENGTLWYSVPSTAQVFKWYGGNSNTATLTGAGALSLSSTATISTNTSIDPANNANTVVIGNVGDASWRARGIGGNAGTNHNWTIGHNGSNLYFAISNGTTAALATWLLVSPAGAATFSSSVTAQSLDIISSSGVGSSNAAGLARFITASSSVAISVGQANSTRRMDFISNSIRVVADVFYLGTVSAQDLVFETTATERLRITSGGNATFTGTVTATTFSGAISSSMVTTALGYTPYNGATNPNGYTSNAGTVTSVSGTGTVSGLSLSGTVTSSGNITLSGTLSASIDNITDEHRLFNNMGDAHGTRTSFDATAPSYNFGWRYVQGSTNGPGVNSANQYYSLYVGLGNEYAATGAGSYGMMMAIPRNVTVPYITIRYNEGNSFAAWQKIAAGYADTAGALTSMNISQFTNNSGYITSSSVGNGTLTLAVSGTGLSGSATFTANQSGNTTFTVTSNATSANTASAIVARDASGNFSAGAITYKNLDPTSTALGTTGTLTPNLDSSDLFTSGTLTGNITFAAPTGTVVNGQRLMIRIISDNATRTISWTTGSNGSYRASSDLALPTATVANKTMYIGFIYNSTALRWDMVALLNNF